MRRHLLLAGLASVTALGAYARDASAAQTLRYQVDQRGDFVLLGNTLGYDCANNPPAPVVGTIGNCGANATTDSGVDTLWRSEQPAAGQAATNNTITVANARTTAMLNVPAGATVTKAYLYWGATLAAAGFDNAITLDRPGGFTQSVTALQTYQSANNSYQGVADVTSIVQAQGPGAYRVSGVDIKNPIDQTDETLFAGWWMVVLYERASDPPRNLAIFDGLDPVSNGAPQNVTLSGFLVPPAFGTAKLGIVAFEGDTSIQGDQFFFNGGAALTDALNPANNFFNRTRSTLGAATTVVGDLPQLAGTAGSMAGMDMDVVDITSKLTVGQTSAPIVANSTGDVYWLAGFVTSVPTFKPDFSTSEKTAVDLNGGSLLPGDTVEYTIVATNTGNDTSINTILTDAIPNGVTYKPGTIQVTAGPNVGPKTDANGDDQGEYDAATNTVRVRIGTGATASMGGTVPIGGTTTVKFQVTINADASGLTINNQAIINGAGQQGYPASDTPTDGNGPTSGQPPTPIIVDMCQDDSNCAAPTPYCNLAPAPNVCVACLIDAHCGGNTPTCDQMTNTCVCVPSGAEVCDGKDNDCNGMIDEGFNVGSSCTVGQPMSACEATGTVVCNGPNASVCSAMPGTPQPEVCDNFDNNCDGNIDDGNPGGGLDCSTMLPGICANGTTLCAAGGMTSCVPTVQPGSVAETCDGTDQDCDGTVDNGFNVGSSCTAGVGACQTTGVFVCNAQGSSSCNAFPGEPGVEICGDAIDNDCDGVVDNNCADSDNDGIPDAVEVNNGTDPNDADSDDDGVLDGQEPDWNGDTDGDGLINALDPDSDDDGLFDGTELGLGCNDPATDPAANNCRPDGDQGATKTDPLDADTDDGGVSDGNEDKDLDGMIDAGETDPTAGHGADDTAPTDTDGDGLSDDLEATIGTDPNDADSDDDGLIDGEEPNPSADTDGDGLINGLDPDSDNDGLYDGTEAGKDCSNPATDPAAGNCIADGDMGATKTSPIDPDTDDGGVNDGAEDFDHDGVIDQGETDPTVGHGADDTLPDSDGDGLPDDYELIIGTDPNDADSDDDGVLDGAEANPTDDTDGDGKINALDPDSDNDGLFDGTEVGNDCSNPATDPAANSCEADGDMGATKTSMVDADTDDGGVIDGDEDKNKNGVVDAGEIDPNDGTDDVNQDSDGDGLSDSEEAMAGTNPNDADSDDDGVIDGDEPKWNEDTDGDGKINALDPDSDNDGLFDGTELGLDCANGATDSTAGNCIADADPTTTTDPLNPDTDGGSVSDGDEDANHNGMVDTGETDPNNAMDDVPCAKDSDCGDETSGKICNVDTGKCEAGCRGTNGNGCPSGEVCSSTTDAAGTCGPATDGVILSGGCACTTGGNSNSGSNEALWALAAVGALVIRRKRR